MNKYLVLYHSPVSAKEQMAKASPEQMKAGMQAWMNWADQNKNSLVDLGAPVQGGAEVSKATTAPNKSTISGFSILQGDSLDSIKKILHDHPHLSAPTNNSIQIFEFLSMGGCNQKA